MGVKFRFTVCRWGWDFGMRFGWNVQVLCTASKVLWGSNGLMFHRSGIRFGYDPIFLVGSDV